MRWSPQRRAQHRRQAEPHDIYERGVKITNAQLAAVPLHHHDWHGEWNYTINAQPNPA